jgi:hypothetical protein
LCEWLSMRPDIEPPKRQQRLGAFAWIVLLVLAALMVWWLAA